MSNKDVTQEMAEETAQAAIASTWDDVAHIQDQVRNPRKWRAELAGVPEDEHVEESARQQIALLAIALRRTQSG